MKKNLIIVFLCLFLFISYSYADYYDYDFYTEDEIEDAYLDGSIDDVSYEEYLDYFYFTNQNETDYEITDEDIVPSKKNLKLIIKPNYYLEHGSSKFKDISQFIKFNWLNLENYYDFGFVAGRGDRINNYSYDKYNQTAGINNFNTNLYLYKIYAGYKNKNKKIIIGDYRARFGMGLTFGQGINYGDAFYYDMKLPYTRTYKMYMSEDKNIYKYNTMFIDNRNLRGLGLEYDFLNIKLRNFYSDVNPSLDSVLVKNYNTNINSRISLNNGYRSKIYGANLEYNFSNSLDNNIGLTYYTNSRKYKLDSSSYFYNENLDYSAYGLYTNIFYDKSKLRAEISGSNSVDAFNNELEKKRGLAYILSAELNKTKNFDCNVSFRNYNKDYINPYANSFSLHTPKKYFLCRDENGYRIDLKYEYPNNSSREKIGCEIKSDIYSHYGMSKLENEKYSIVYGPKLTDSIYFLKLKYTIKKTAEYELTRKLVDKDIETRGDDSNTRKDAYNYFTIKYFFDSSILKIKYGTQEKYIDISNKKYYGESLSILYSMNLFRGCEIIPQVKLRDPNVDKRNDERYSYNIKTKYEINENLNIKFDWFILDTEKEKFLEYDTDTEIGYTYIGSLNRWKMEVDYKF
jgi:hypothetical protein